MAIKLPEIPRSATSEMYNYFVILHQNIKQLEEQIIILQNKFKEN